MVCKLILQDMFPKLLLPLLHVFAQFICNLAREKIVGWYHTGPKLHQNDTKINELVQRYCTNSVS